MHLFILLPFLLFSALAISAGNEDSALSKFYELELANRIGEKNAGERTVEYFATLDRKQQPRAWIYFQALTHYYDPNPKFNIEDLLNEARRLADHELMTYLFMIRLGLDASAGVERGQIMQKVKEGLDNCQAWENEFWCGRLNAEIANYLFNVNDLGLGMKYAKKSTELLETLVGVQRYFFYDAQAILANLLDRSGQSKQALSLMEDACDWFDEQGYPGDAAVMANNIALKLMRDDSQDMEKIRRYLRKAQNLIRDFPNKELSMHVNYTQATFFLKNGQYREARGLLKQSYKDYLTFGMKNLAYDALIGQAKAEFELGMHAELAESLILAEPLLNGAYSRESLLFLELKYLVAKKSKNHDTALKIHEDLLDLWRKVQKDDDLKEKNRLSIELGLQVEEQRNELLQKKSEISRLQLDSAERIKYFAGVVSLLLLLTVVLLLTSLKQKARINASQGKIKRILDNIDQGLLTIDCRRRIDTDYSKKALSILDVESDIAGKTFEEVALARSDLSNESKSMVHEIMQNSLGEDILAWEINAHHLVNEMRFGLQQEKVVDIRWIPIVDQKNCLVSILVALTDVSQERKLTRDLFEKNRQLLGLPDKLREILQAPHQNLAEYFSSTKACLRRFESDKDLPSMRLIHTQKGIARTIGLKSISAALHDLESLAHAESSGAALQNCQRELEESEAFFSIVSQYVSPLCQPGLMWLANLLTPHLKTWIQHAGDHGIEFRALTVRDEVLQWSRPDLDVIEEICIHAINNSLDHGYCFPKRSGVPINDPEIAIWAYRKDGNIILEITDNGVGLNLQKLKSIAEEKGVLASDERSICDVVFIDEVSTADDVSLASGRGIGLASVKNRITEKKGLIQIRNRTEGSGTLLQAQWPAA